MPFLKRNRKAFLNEKEKEMREKLSERNEKRTVMPGIQARVGIDFNDNVKSGILRTIRKVPLLKNMGEEPLPSSEAEETIHYFPLNLPVR